MEKRFILFIVLSMAIMLGWFSLMNIIAPPPQHVQQPRDPADLKQPADPQPADPQPGDPLPGDPLPGEKVPEGPDKPENQPDDPQPDQPGKKPAGDVLPDVDEPAVEAAPTTSFALRRHGLGAIDPSSGYRMLVTTINRGAAIERIELSSHKYFDLEDKSGYLGHLALSDNQQGAGCRIHFVGAGTPAATAKPTGGGSAGLQVSDLITEVDGQEIFNSVALLALLEKTKPSDEISITVLRGEAEKAASLQFKAKLTRHPLEMIRPEPNYLPEVAGNLALRNPMSCLVSLRGPGNMRSRQLDDYLHSANWELVFSSDWQVEFRIVVDKALLKEIGQTGTVEVIKRYKLKPAPQNENDNESFKAYHVGIEIEIRNISAAEETAALRIAYQIDGPNGIPDEGWWYANKIHPSKFSGVGIRDILWKSPGQPHTMIGCSRIFKDAVGKAKFTTLFTKNDPAKYPDKLRSVQYMGVDAHYFSVLLLPGKEGQEAPYVFDRAIATPVHAVDKEKDQKQQKRTNVSFQLTSELFQIEAEQPIIQNYVLFAGPKDQKLLAQYDLQECITYGWFSWVAKPLVAILHFFYGLVRNYGLAIILLTILVRGMMFPLSRKAAKNMMKTQTLAPEMKKIKEKYKNDMEKQGKAMRELYKKNNFNPLSGCWMMFVQLPIFLGLYRGLSTDIELRGQPLIPGLGWCSNLVAPDQLWYWKPYIWDYFAGESTGWLGPYLNVLPLVTIALFMLQQKMFTPPALDDQARQQQRMMKFMMLFMGVLFFKVPAGLCIYFITSSLWGIAERKLLPKPTPPTEQKTTTPIKTAASSSSNGAARRAKEKKKQKQKQKRK